MSTAPISAVTEAAAGSFFRFVCVGCAMVAINLAMLWFLTSVAHMSYLAAWTLAFFALNALGYALNKRVSFRLGRQWRVMELTRYFGVMGLSLAVNLGLMVLLVEVVGLHFLVASLVLSALFAVLNYLAHRSVTFGLSSRRKRDRDADYQDPLRVLQVSAFFPAHGGGIEAVAGHLAAAMPPRGVQVVWMAGGPLCQMPQASAYPGVTIERARSIDLFERRLGLPVPVWGPGSVCTLWDHCRDCDVVHVHDYQYAPTLLAIMFARLLRKPLVITQHVGEIPFQSPATRALLAFVNRTIGSWALARADQVLFVGRPVLAYFDRLVRWRRPPRLIPNGVDHALFHPRAAPDDASGVDGPLRALFVGRFVEKKGMHLVRACADLPGIEWSLAGKGPLSPEGWPEALKNRVLLLGELSPTQVADAMRQADLLVLPSRGEGFPLVVQEALACGTPVLVSTDVEQAFPDRHPDCVISVDVDGPDAAARLRDALCALAVDPQRVRRHRQTATALASRWSWERCCAAYHEIYDELAGVAVPGPRSCPQPK